MLILFIRRMIGIFTLDFIRHTGGIRHSIATIRAGIFPFGILIIIGIRAPIGVIIITTEAVGCRSR